MRGRERERETLFVDLVTGTYLLMLQCSLIAGMFFVFGDDQAWFLEPQSSTDNPIVCIFQMGLMRETLLTITGLIICLHLIDWLLLVPQTGLCVTSAPF